VRELLLHTSSDKYFCGSKIICREIGKWVDGLIDSERELNFCMTTLVCFLKIVAPDDLSGGGLRVIE